MGMFSPRGMNMSGPDVVKPPSTLLPPASAPLTQPTYVIGSTPNTCNLRRGNWLGLYHTHIYGVNSLKGAGLAGQPGSTRRCTAMIPDFGRLG